MAANNHSNTMGEEEFNKLLKNPPTTVVIYAHKAFNAFCSNSHFEDIKIPFTDELVYAKVFRGKIGDIFNQTGASQAYYSRIRQMLLDAGSIVILERGSAHAQSVVIVRPDRPPPTVEESNVKSREFLLTLAARFDTIESRLEKLEAGRGGINVVAAFTDVEQRLARLESKTERDG